jgi:hypothetical protein
MDDYRLIGFISDLNGNQAQLFTADPVLRRGDDLFVAEARNWTRDDLRKVKASALRFVEPVPEDEQITVHPGDVVWLAGRTFVAELGRINRTSSASIAQLRREIGRWNRTRRMGFAWTTGTRSQLARLIAEPTTDITALLHKALFDRQEISHGDAESYFGVFRALVQSDTLDNLITRALYYRERHDDQRMLFVSRRAVRAGVVSSQDEFLEHMTARARRLSEERLADLTPVANPQRAVQANILALLGSVVMAESDRPAADSSHHWKSFASLTASRHSSRVAASMFLAALADGGGSSTAAHDTEMPRR